MKTIGIAATVLAGIWFLKGKYGSANDIKTRIVALKEKGVPSFEIQALEDNLMTAQAGEISMMNVMGHLKEVERKYGGGKDPMMQEWEKWSFPAD